LPALCPVVKAALAIYEKILYSFPNQRDYPPY
jgi:hypothetical protein